MSEISERDRLAKEYQADDNREKIGPANSFKAGWDASLEHLLSKSKQNFFRIPTMSMVINKEALIDRLYKIVNEDFLIIEALKAYILYLATALKNETPDNTEQMDRINKILDNVR